MSKDGTYFNLRVLSFYLTDTTGCLTGTCVLHGQVLRLVGLYIDFYSTSIRGPSMLKYIFGMGFGSEDLYCFRNFQFRL